MDSLDDFLDSLDFAPVARAPAAAAPAKAAPAAKTARPAEAAAAAKPAKAAAAKPAKAAAAKPAKAAAAADEGPAAPAEEFVMSTVKDHIKKKGMWAGALTPVLIPDLAGLAPAPPSGDAGPELVDLERPHTPALLKIFDEVLVNASDHHKTHEKGPASLRVTRIDVEFDPASGRYSVFNDGPGIPQGRHEGASRQEGRPVFTPEVAFAVPLAGTNIDKDAACVRGGINGLGAKIANINSAVFEVETADGAHCYRQEFRDRLDRIGAPEILDAAAARRAGWPAEALRPHTRVSFVPAYAALGYAAGPGGAPPAAAAADLDAWIRLRAHQTAAYVGPKVAVRYNGAPCPTTSAGALGRLLLGALGPEAAAQGCVLEGVARAAEEPFKSHPWQVAVVVLPPGVRAGRRATKQNMTVVNGVLCNKGTHVQHLKRLLGEAVEERLRKATKLRKGKDAAQEKERKLGVAETLGGVRLVMCGAVPGADWGGQRKDELQVPKATVDHYAFPATFLKDVGAAVAEKILVAQGARAGRVVHEKYIPAHQAGKAQRAHATLLAAEGDSAITFLKAGLSRKGKGKAPPGAPTRDWCGIISLQGVILNAAREVSELATAGGETVAVRSARLQENKRLLALADAWGLRYDRRYETPAELAELHYGRLLLCVDQDLDGTGKIGSLVLVWLFIFWPALFRAGRVGRLMTPLVRVYPRRAGAAPPAEFFYEEELHRWLAAHPAWAEAYLPPKYYKGLGTHASEEVRRMFAPDAYRRAVYTFTLDDAAARLFEVYFGADPALRKRALVTPVAHLAPAEADALHARREIPVGRVQLDVDTKMYKNDAIKRQIPGAVDGLNPARRKIVMGAIKRFNGQGASSELKIFQLGGYCADKMAYHHGDASLNATITYMAQAFPGARRFPLLQGIGQFGTRHGDPAASARYISVRPSPLVRLVFPPEDRWFLPYVLEDGVQAEPRYFVPVAPLAVLESNSNISEGWNHDSFARAFDAVLAVVRAFIDGEPALHATADRLRAEGPTPAALAMVRALEPAWPLPAETAGFAGEVRPYRGQDHSFGMYTWDEARRTITVTDLPIGVATAKFLETLSKPGRAGKANPRDAFIEKVVDNSTEAEVSLDIRLRPGAFETICAEFGSAELDPIEDALQLRASLRPHLNFYSADGGVLELDGSYLAALLYWAPFRRDLYRERLTRELIVTELRIAEEEAIVAYIALAAELDLASLADDDAAAAVLEARGFVRLDTALLHRPDYTPNAQLRTLLTSGPGADYNHLLSLQERQLVQAAVVKRHKTIATLRATLDRVRAQLAESPVPGASVWRDELRAFEAFARNARSAAESSCEETA